MMKFGGAKSRKFSRLNEVQEEEPYSLTSPIPQEHKKPAYPTTPPRGKRMLQSMACVTGSPTRHSHDEDDEEPHHDLIQAEPVSEEHDSISEHSPQQLNVEEVAQDKDDETQETQASLRQRQLDEALHSVISSDSATTRQLENVSLRLGLEVQPTYDDAHVVFENPSSETGTDISRASKTHQSAAIQGSRSMKPAKPVVIKDEDDAVGPPELSPRSLRVSKTGESSALPTGDAYDNVESLIARVKRLDAVIQAGDEEASARSAEEASRSVTKENVKVGNPGPAVEQSTNVPRVIKPLDSPRHDSPIRQRRSHDEDDSSEQHVTSKDVDDGSQHFQVLYRRGRDSPVSSIVKTSVASSSIVTMSSFHIPETPVIQRSVPVVTPTTEKSRSANQVTARPFFWRTHPKGIFTSYRPNRPKTMLALLQDGNKKAILSLPGSSRVLSPDSSISSKSLRMRTVQEVGEQKNGSRYRATSQETFWSKDSDPVADSND